ARREAGTRHTRLSRRPPRTLSPSAADVHHPERHLLSAGVAARYVPDDVEDVPRKPAAVFRDQIAAAVRSEAAREREDGRRVHGKSGRANRSPQALAAAGDHSALRRGHRTALPRFRTALHRAPDLLDSLLLVL